MSKAQELATSLDDLGAAIPYCTEAAALLRTQDALLRQALEALWWMEKAKRALMEITG